MPPRSRFDACFSQLGIHLREYLPTVWTEDTAKRAKARIPAHVPFQTKIDLALGMIERAVQDGLPGEILLADSAYGESQAFRETVRLLGLDYAVGIHAR